MANYLFRARRHANFDPVARLYRWAEYPLLGPLLKRTREHFLLDLEGAGSALVLGDGDGRFLARLLAAAPGLHATAVDTSAGMLRLLGQRCAFAGTRVKLLHASVTDLPALPELSATDLIVTHFLLDCLTDPQVEALTQHLAGTVAPGCLWLVSDFDVPRRQPWRTLGAFYIRGLYGAFRLLTGLRVQRLPNPQRALTRAGFVRLHRAERLHGLLYSELWRLLPRAAHRP